MNKFSIIGLVVIVALCAIQLCSAEESSLTLQQMDEAKYLMYKLNGIVGDIQARCHFDDNYKNETCFIHVDQEVKLGFLHQHIKFDASVVAQVNLTAYTAEILAVVNSQTLYEKTISLDQLKNPICIPFFDVLKLCIRFTNINFNVHANCFTALMTVDVEFMNMELKLLSDNFGWNQSQCASLL
jgi:hypothetical protein